LRRTSTIKCVLCRSDPCLCRHRAPPAPQPSKRLQLGVAALLGGGACQNCAGSAGRLGWDALRKVPHTIAEEPAWHATTASRNRTCTEDQAYNPHSPHSAPALPRLPPPSPDSSIPASAHRVNETRGANSAKLRSWTLKRPAMSTSRMRGRHATRVLAAGILATLLHASPCAAFCVGPAHKAVHGGARPLRRGFCAARGMRMGAAPHIDFCEVNVAAGQTPMLFPLRLRGGLARSVIFVTLRCRHCAGSSRVQHQRGRPAWQPTAAPEGC